MQSVRKYLVAPVAGLCTFTAVYLIDQWLARRALAANATYIDDILLSALVIALVLSIQRHYESELQRQREMAALLQQTNHHIRNALQVIVFRANLNTLDQASLDQIKEAVDRIDWALKSMGPVRVRRAYNAETSKVAQSRLCCKLTPALHWIREDSLGPDQSYGR